ncbi:MARVEL-like domain protein [Cordyceps fumosorosea ARSEF 2679]|uniref:MARVEL-like domain protein n=1 Tax=Cordyceps fumosorosea (strain ARSEF 2679) TaxID=1081104 RepID=A0A168E4H4_CORFA|nr:MARVEL-like domain protein [Cordyceps fumosorosea ARSEF 2679]OAA73367.1 MARVEL-like domain protein [Cordyceps fumosorosea ARSEF 2679]
MEGAVSAIVHGLVGVFLIIELGLTAYLVSRFNGDVSRFNFMLFNSLWTLVVILYTGVVKRAFSRVYHAIVGVALLAITAIFWFAGSIAIAARIPIRCHGFHDCQVAQAATAFGFFLWAITTGLTVIEAIGSRSSSRV